MKKPSKAKAKMKNRKSANSSVSSLISELFRTLPDKRYSVKNLIKATGALTRDEKEEVRRTVRTLLETQTIEPVADGKYRLSNANRETFEGVVDMTPSGAFYVQVEGLDQDIYVSGRNNDHVLNGDRVKVIIIRPAKGEMHPEGEVVEIVAHSDKKYVGVLELSDNYAFVNVDNRKFPHDVFIPLRDLHGAQNGQKVLVKINDWPDTMKNPVGEIVDVLGTPGDNNTEMHAILAEFDLPYTYPKEVEEAADRIPEELPAEEIATRRDFRGIATFTIDPTDAKDFDDALSMRRLPNGNIEVGVHIADVTYYVHPGDIIDTEAQNRATSVYLVDRTIPMLPERLSNGLCSLRPNEEKFCFSAVFELNEEAQVQNEWFGRTVILSDRRFTYDEAQQVIETGEGDMRDEIITLNALARKLRAERFRNGAISFEREEAKFDLDENGKPLRVYFKQMKEANQLIEEFMLLANRKVAEFVGRKRPGVQNSARTFVYRIHDKPNSDKLSQLRSFAMRFGYKMKSEATGKALAKDINKLMKNIHGKQEENLISTLAIRTMAKATYSTDNIGHYGLAFDFYTHFTSPIRRYPDMMVHRLLAHYLAGGKSEDKEYYEGQCEHSSAMEIRAADAERASIKYKMVEFMLDKVDQEFDGHISGVTEWGIYVELDDTKIEGMVSVRELTDDYYVFDEESYALRGERTGRSFTLGDGVRIKVLRADLMHKQLDFALTAIYDFETKQAIPVVAAPALDATTSKAEHHAEHSQKRNRSRKS